MKRRTAKKHTRRAIHEWRKRQKRVRDRHDFAWKGLTLRLERQVLMVNTPSLCGILELS